jgi:hypothetical protein
MTETTATTKPVTCACLCGESVGPKSTFRQGHDQRFISLLARETVDGTLANARVAQLQLPTEVDGQDIQERINVTGNAVSKFFSDALRFKFDSAVARRWDKVVKDSQPKPERKTKKKSESNEGTEQVQDEALTLGASIKVKVGRWTYDATVHGMNQAGKVTAVRYYDKNDKEFVKPEGKFKIV